MDEGRGRISRQWLRKRLSHLDRDRDNNCFIEWFRYGDSYRDVLCFGKCIWHRYSDRDGLCFWKRIRDVNFDGDGISKLLSERFGKWLAGRVYFHLHRICIDVGIRIVRAIG